MDAETDEQYGEREPRANADGDETYVDENNAVGANDLVAETKIPEDTESDEQEAGPPNVNSGIKLPLKPAAKPVVWNALDDAPPLTNRTIDGKSPLGSIRPGAGLGATPTNRNGIDLIVQKKAGMVADKMQTQIDRLGRHVQAMLDLQAGLGNAPSSSSSGTAFASSGVSNASGSSLFPDRGRGLGQGLAKSAFPKQKRDISYEGGAFARTYLTGALDPGSYVTHGELEKCLLGLIDHMGRKHDKAVNRKLITLGLIDETAGSASTNGYSNGFGRSSQSPTRDKQAISRRGGASGAARSVSSSASTITSAVEEKVRGLEVQLHRLQNHALARLHRIDGQFGIEEGTTTATTNTNTNTNTAINNDNMLKTSFQLGGSSGGDGVAYGSDGSGSSSSSSSSSMQMPLRSQVDGLAQRLARMEEAVAGLRQGLDMDRSERENADRAARAREGGLKAAVEAAVEATIVQKYGLKEASAHQDEGSTSDSSSSSSSSSSKEVEGKFRALEGRVEGRLEEQQRAIEEIKAMLKENFEGDEDVERQFKELRQKIEAEHENSAQEREQMHQKIDDHIDAIVEELGQTLTDTSKHNEEKIDGLHNLLQQNFESDKTNEAEKDARLDSMEERVKQFVEKYGENIESILNNQSSNNNNNNGSSSGDGEGASADGTGGGSTDGGGASGTGGSGGGGLGKEEVEKMIEDKMADLKGSGGGGEGSRDVITTDVLDTINERVEKSVRMSLFEKKAGETDMALAEIKGMLKENFEGDEDVERQFKELREKIEAEHEASVKERETLHDEIEEHIALIVEELQKTLDEHKKHADEQIQHLNGLVQQNFESDKISEAEKEHQMTAVVEKIDKLWKTVIEGGADNDN